MSQPAPQYGDGALRIDNRSKEQAREVIERQSAQMLLIEDLLDISRIPGGKLSSTGSRSILRRPRVRWCRPGAPPHD